MTLLTIALSEETIVTLRACAIFIHQGSFDKLGPDAKRAYDELVAAHIIAREREITRERLLKERNERLAAHARGL
jgi:hypothetical protein